MGKSLLSAGNPLAILDEQKKLLAPRRDLPSFSSRLRQTGLNLSASRVEILQINVGRLCNQTCAHCHVDAGPDRTEIMSKATMESCLRLLESPSIHTVDITGGAPEMNPHFRWLVEKVADHQRKVIDRCNLTILLAPRYEDLPEFFARHRVELVASLPYFSASSTDRQRGDGVFDRSIAAIRRLNRLGYGLPDSGLNLHFVYNPAGAFLPPAQSEIEGLFRSQLWERYEIRFNRLYAIANQPINRFLDFLLRSGNYEAYMQRLIAAFNPAAVDGLMCRNTLSVGWDGKLFDCDFNQMLDLELSPGMPRTIAEVNLDAIVNRPISTGLHCYACTAGQGSSCGGATVAAPASSTAPMRSSR